MANLYTAIVLSSRPVNLSFEGVDVIASVQVVTGPAQLHAARLEALGRMTPP